MTTPGAIRHVSTASRATSRSGPSARGGGSVAPAGPSSVTRTREGRLAIEGVYARFVEVVPPTRPYRSGAFAPLGGFGRLGGGGTENTGDGGRGTWSESVGPPGRK